MDLTTLSSVLGKVYNTLGNNYLIQNFITEPFEFDVKVIYDRDDEIADYIIKVFSKPAMPLSFYYTPEIKREKNLDGVDISVIKEKFKEIYKYIETGNTTKKFVRVQFMNLKQK